MNQLVVEADLLSRIDRQFPMEFAARGSRSPWKDYVRSLEAANRLAFVPAGETLVARAVYIDLSQPCRGPIRALEGQTAGSRNRYLAREHVPADVWCAVVEHCACVERATGEYTPSDNLPSLRAANARRIAA